MIWAKISQIKCSKRDFLDVSIPLINISLIKMEHWCMPKINLKKTGHGKMWCDQAKWVRTRKYWFQKQSNKVDNFFVSYFYFFIFFFCANLQLPISLEPVNFNRVCYKRELFKWCIQSIRKMKTEFDWFQTHFTLLHHKCSLKNNNIKHGFTKWEETVLKYTL